MVDTQSSGFRVSENALSPQIRKNLEEEIEKETKKIDRSSKVVPMVTLDFFGIQNQILSVGFLSHAYLLGTPFGTKKRMIEIIYSDPRKNFSSIFKKLHTRPLHIEQLGVNGILGLKILSPASKNVSKMRPLPEEIANKPYKIVLDKSGTSGSIEKLSQTEIEKILGRSKNIISGVLVDTGTSKKEICCLEPQEKVIGLKKLWGHTIYVAGPFDTKVDDTLYHDRECC